MRRLLDNFEAVLQKALDTNNTSDPLERVEQNQEHVTYPKPKPPVPASGQDLQKATIGEEGAHRQMERKHDSRKVQNAVNTLQRHPAIKPLRWNLHCAEGATKIHRRHKCLNAATHRLPTILNSILECIWRAPHPNVCSAGQRPCAGVTVKK